MKSESIGARAQSVQMRQAAWAAEYDDYLATWELYKARWKAFVRMLRIRTAERPETEMTNAGSRIPIDSVVGTIDACGQEVHHLPALPRKLLPAWLQGFRTQDFDRFPVLGVSAGQKGWYLTGGIQALLFLEILRARGQRLIRVRVEAESRDCRGCLERVAMESRCLSLDASQG